jgi:fervidolysin-like protein
LGSVSGGHSRLRPWEGARITVGGADGKAVLEVLPARVALRWEAQEHGRLQEALRALVGSRGKLHTLESERLFLLELEDTSVGPALWKDLAGLQEQGLLDWASPTLRDVDSGLRLIATDEIVVRLRDDAGAQAKLRRLVAPLGLQIVQRNEFVASQFMVKGARLLGLEVLEKADALAALPEVKFAAPNFLTEATK